jgi:DNA-binding transcriptional ArsR family regulator
MAGDLLSTIAEEIEARLAELRPSYEEYEQLLSAAAAFDNERAPASPARRRGRPPGRTSGSPSTRAGRARATPRASTRKSPSGRSARGAAREAILAALEHGSHTVSELSVVTAMKASNLNSNVRRLLAEGALVKTEREGKTAYRLPD